MASSGRSGMRTAINRGKERTGGVSGVNGGEEPLVSVLYEFRLQASEQDWVIIRVRSATRRSLLPDAGRCEHTATVED